MIATYHPNVYIIVSCGMTIKGVKPPIKVEANAFMLMPFLYQYTPLGLKRSTKLILDLSKIQYLVINTPATAPKEVPTIFKALNIEVALLNHIHGA